MEEKTKKCECYHERKTIQEPKLDVITGKITRFVEKTESYCSGTKKCDQCDCAGDRIRCTFYPEIREKARAERRSELESIELEFYRDFILRNDLLSEVASQYIK